MRLLLAEGQRPQVTVFLGHSIFYRGPQQVSSQAFIVLVDRSAVLEDVGRDRDNEQRQEGLQSPGWNPGFQTRIFTRKVVAAALMSEKDPARRDREEAEDLADAGKNTDDHVRRGYGQQGTAEKEIQRQRPYDRPAAEAIENPRPGALSRGMLHGCCIKGRFSQGSTFDSRPGSQCLSGTASRSHIAPVNSPAGTAVGAS